VSVQSPPATQIREIALSSISAGANDRTAFPAAEIRQLADSIAEHGLAQPITVRPVAGNYRIAAGERRFRAFQLLGRESIPAIVREMTDEEEAALMLLENLQRSDLSPIDEARAYRSRMQRFGYTVSQVAAQAQVSPGRVNGRLGLLELREDVQHLIVSGQLPLGHAQAMAGLDGNRQGLALRTLQDAERLPNLPEWRAVCGQLYEQQQQDVLFDPDDFMSTVELPVAEQRQGLAFDADPELPPMRTKATFSETMTSYLAELEGSDDPHCQEAAKVVATVCAGLTQKGWLRA
jgi:ParB/RepB/Spo0J family partition protein